MAGLAIQLYLDVQKVVKVGNTPRDVYSCSQRILDEGYTIQCPVIHGYSQVLQPCGLSSAVPTLSLVADAASATGSAVRTRPCSGS